MITVKRHNYPARVLRGKLVPESHECRYFHEGKEIAYYYSGDDVLYLRTEYIGTNFKKSPYERALQCKMKEAYIYLFQMLNVDKTSSVSEYCFSY